MCLNILCLSLKNVKIVSSKVSSKPQNLYSGISISTRKTSSWTPSKTTPKAISLFLHFSHLRISSRSLRPSIFDLFSSMSTPTCLTSSTSLSGKPVGCCGRTEPQSACSLFQLKRYSQSFSNWCLNPKESSSSRFCPHMALSNVSITTNPILWLQSTLTSQTSCNSLTEVPGWVHKPRSGGWEWSTLSSYREATKVFCRYLPCWRTNRSTNLLFYILCHQYGANSIR